MKKSTLNILFCMSSVKNPEMFKKSFAKTLHEYQQEQIPENDRIEIGIIDMVGSKTEANQAIVSGNYNVVICRDKLGNGNNEPIGIKCIEAWQEMQPGIRIILSVGDNKLGGNSMVKLFKRDYYDAIYQNDVSKIGMLLDLILNSRTQDAAFNYYGIRNNAEYQRELAEQKEKSIAASMQSKDARVSINPAQEMEEETDEEIWKSAMKETSAMEQMPTEEYADEMLQREDEEEVKEESNQPAYSQQGEMPVDGNTLRESLMGDIGDYFPDRSTAMGTDKNKISGAEERREPSRNIKERSQTEKSQNDEYVRNTKEREKEAPASAENKSAEMMSDEKEEHELEKVDGETQLVLNKVELASVLLYEGYIISAISDQALIIEVPGAHFMQVKEYLPNMSVTLITPRLQK